MLNQNAATAAAIKGLLNQDRATLQTQLEKLDKSLAAIASAMDGFRDLAHAVRPEAKTVVSASAISSTVMCEQNSGGVRVRRCAFRAATRSRTSSWSGLSTSIVTATTAEIKSGLTAGQEVVIGTASELAGTTDDGNSGGFGGVAVPGNGPIFRQGGPGGGAGPNVQVGP